MEDTAYLAKWLADPSVLRWFPMTNEKEVADSIRIWTSYIMMNAAVTAEWESVPCGMANLYIQPFKKYAHQCLFSIVVDEKYRNKGVGTAMIQELIRLGKSKFGIEILHLEVYDGNPAINLYKRLGFVEYGRHPRFLKSGDEYIDKVMMEKTL
jgi:RimJ/RimL family protein N-acetyltransferase